MPEGEPQNQESEKPLEEIPSIDAFAEILKNKDWDKIDRLEKFTREIKGLLIGLEDSADSAYERFHNTELFEPGKIESHAAWIISNLQSIEEGIEEIKKKMPNGKLMF